MTQDDAAVRRFHHACKAQLAWSASSVKTRLEPIRRLRRLLVRDAEGFVKDLAPRPEAAALMAEVVPLADACLFLEQEAPRLLAPRRLGARGRPWWFTGHAAEVRREAYGVVLILSPDNYPLLLPGVQAVQALAAGNAVLVKPAPGCRAVMTRLAGLLAEAGLPEGLFTVLDEEVAAVRPLLDEKGPDLVVLTGSTLTGCRVLDQLADFPTPAIVELSGSDPVFVLPSADIGMVADALAFGVALNGGATCIAPRRVFVPEALGGSLEAALAERLDRLPEAAVPKPVRERLREPLAEARRGGARVLPVPPDLDAPTMRPFAVLDADPGWRLLRIDLFAPCLAVVPVHDMEHALEADGRCPYALGASVFGDEAEARALAGRINAGVVTINDLIAPTADPRLPFGGRDESGYGVTRGAEGLLALTRPKAVTVRKGRFRPHYEPQTATHKAIGLDYLQAVHGEKGRFRALGRLVRNLKALGSSAS